MIATSLLGAGLVSACGGSEDETEQGAGPYDEQNRPTSRQRQVRQC